MKCQNCGTDVMKGAQFCPNCGSNQLVMDSPQQNYGSQFYGEYQNGSFAQQPGYAQQNYQQGFQQPYEMQQVSTADAPVWLKIVCLFFWLVGIIMYFVKKEKEPVYAKSCLTFGLIGLAIEFVFGILF